MILDTSFLVDLMYREERAIEKATEIEDENREVNVPTTVVYELFLGVGAGGMPAKEREKIARVVGSRTIVPLTESIAETAGEFNGNLMGTHEEMKPIDALVAGTGIELDEPVLTDDADDFSKAPGLEIETY